MATTQGKAKRKKLFGARFTSMVSVALVLFVLGLMALGTLTAARLTQVVRERFTVTLTMTDAAPSGFAKRLAQRVEGEPYAARVAYVSADSALAVVAAELGESPMDFLDYNPMRESIELQLRADYAVADSLPAVLASLRGMGGVHVESIDYNRALIDVVNTNMRRLGIGMALVVALLLVVSLSLIANTVRLALHADRFLINTMRLVGATRWFIRRPFVVANMWSGFVAAIVALAALAGAVAYVLSQQTSTMLADLVVQPKWLVALAAGIVVVGMLIPACAAWRTTSKYLGMSVDELYLI